MRMSLLIFASLISTSCADAMDATLRAGTYATDKTMCRKLAVKAEPDNADAFVAEEDTRFISYKNLDCVLEGLELVNKVQKNLVFSCPRGRGSAAFKVKAEYNNQKGSVSMMNKVFTLCGI